MEEIINSYLTFKVGENLFGVHVDHVVEIMEFVQPKSKTTNLPYLLGFCEHRDEVIPMLDSGIKFGFEPISIHNQTCVIVLGVDNGSDKFNVALVVDYVSDVIEVAEECKQYIETSYKPGYIAFSAKNDDNLVLILDVNKIFSDTDILLVSKLMAENQ